MGFQYFVLYKSLCLKNVRFNFWIQKLRIYFAGAQRKSIFNLNISTDVENLKDTDSNHGTYISFNYFLHSHPAGIGRAVFPVFATIVPPS